MVEKSTLNSLAPQNTYRVIMLVPQMAVMRNMKPRLMLPPVTLAQVLARPSIQLL